MNSRKVEYVEHVPTITLYDSLDTFQFQPTKGWILVQKVLFFLLRKLGAFQTLESITYTTRTIDTVDFMQKLFTQIDGIQIDFNIKPTRLLIGPEDFRELMGGDDVRQYLTFNTKYGYGREILGLTVEVIPWMRGVLVMK